METPNQPMSNSQSTDSHPTHAAVATASVPPDSPPPGGNIGAGSGNNGNDNSRTGNTGPDQPAPWWSIASLLLQPSLLYITSAGLVLAGIGQVLGPAFGRETLSAEHFSCLGSLLGYELAIFGVMLLITLWKKVHDDAISLTLVIALFLTATPIALNVMSAAYPQLTIGLGALVFALSLTRLSLISRWIVAGISPSVMLVLAVMLLIISIWPGALGRLVASGHTDALLLPVWLAGYNLAVGCLVLLPALLVPTAIRAPDQGKWRTTAFLHTYAMRWIITTILAIGTIAQFYAMSWAFGLRINTGMLIPGLLPIAISAAVLLRAYQPTLSAGFCALLWLPTVVVIGLMMNRASGLPEISALSFITHPASVLLPIGLVSLYLAYRIKAAQLYGAGAVMASLGLTLFLVNTGHKDIYALIATLSLITSLALSACLIKKTWPAVAASILLGIVTIAAAAIAGLEANTAYHLSLISVGVGIAAIACVLGESGNRNWTLAAILLTSLPGLNLTYAQNTPTLIAASIPVLIPCLGALVGMCTNRPLLACLFLLPTVGLVRALPTVSAGWVMLAAGFLLLAAGAGVSLTKDRWLTPRAGANRQRL